MHRAVQTIRQIARHEIGQLQHIALGLVKSVQGADDAVKAFSCTVELRDTGIVLPKVPIATNLIGTAALPREKDLVVVVFAGGDLHGRIVIGRLYTEDVSPPKHGPGEAVTILPGDEESPEKRLELRVNTPGDGTRSIHLTLDGPVKVELEIKDDGIRLQAQDATIKVTQSGASDGQIEVKVGDAKLTLQQSGDISMEASGTLNLKGSKVEISGDTSVKIAGTTIDLN